MKKLLVIAAAALLSACAMFSSPPVYGDIPDCPSLVPPSLLADVPGVMIPDGDLAEDAQAWMQAFIGQTGQLEKANERPDAVQHINKTCLDMHRKALERSKRGFFARLFGG
jgi:hypothetical protein